MTDNSPPTTEQWKEAVSGYLRARHADGDLPDLDLMLAMVDELAASADGTLVLTRRFRRRIQYLERRGR